MKQLLDFVKELSFVRTGGSSEEKKAAELVLREIRIAKEELGVSATDTILETFYVPSAHIKQCRIVSEGKEIPCVPYVGSGNIEGQFKPVFLDDATEIDFAGVGDLSDSVVILNELVDEQVYKRLVEHKAAAFLVAKGKHYHTFEEASLYPNDLRPKYTKHGIIPGFYITAKDAAKIVRDEVELLSLTLQQEEVQLESRNIIQVIPGTQQEEIVLTAHYDSVPLGTGSWDNATGTTALLAIFKYFLAHPPKRTLRFIWCGSEEKGLLGSKAYVKEHESELEKIQFVFNFDMCGTTLGRNDIFVTGNEELECYIEQYCKRKGYSAKIRKGVHSSDSAPFCDNNIPALGLSRGTVSGEIHTIHDLIDILDEKAINKNVDFAVGIIDEIANAVILPVKREVSEERKKELDKYFSRSNTSDSCKDAGR